MQVMAKHPGQPLHAWKENGGWLRTMQGRRAAIGIPSSDHKLCTHIASSCLAPVVYERYLFFSASCSLASAGSSAASLTSLKSSVVWSFRGFVGAPLGLGESPGPGLLPLGLGGQRRLRPRGVQGGGTSREGRRSGTQRSSSRARSGMQQACLDQRSNQQVKDEPRAGNLYPPCGS